MSATAARPQLTDAERLEQRRSALILRKQELQEALAAAPADIAIKQEKWFSSERPADERALYKAKQALAAMEDEFVEVEAGIGIVDGLLADELAKQRAARDLEVQAEAARLSLQQADAVRKFGEQFTSLWAERFPEYVEATAALGAFYQAHRPSIGDRAPFVLDPLPVTFRSLLSVCHDALIRDETGGLTPAVLADVVPPAADRPLDLDSPNAQRV